MLIGLKAYTCIEGVVKEVFVRALFTVGLIEKVHNVVHTSRVDIH
mgnify:CR=1 FL=1